MQTITTVGLDIAKTAFQVHAIDAAGNIIVRRQLNRRYVLAFFQNYHRALSVSRLADHHIIGRAKLKRSVTRCA
jgi:transposase